MESDLAVYIIDDGQVDSAVTRAAFEEQGIAVRTLTWPERAQEAVFLQALQKVEEALPHLIVLDGHLASWLGTDFLNLLKTDRHYGSVPVVVLSDSEEAGDIHAAYQQHAAAYLHKPAEFGTLCSAVSGLVRYWQLCRLPQPKKNSK